MQRSALCRSRRELSNEYLLAKFGYFSCTRIPGSLLFFLFVEKDWTTLLACFDTAESEPCKVCPLSAYRSLLQISQVEAISEGEMDADALTTKIQDLQAKRAQLDLDIQSLNEEIAGYEEQIAESKGLRKEEVATFDAALTDMEKAISYVYSYSKLERILFKRLTFFYYLVISSNFLKNIS